VGWGGVKKKMKHGLCHMMLSTPEVLMFLCYFKAYHGGSAVKACPFSTQLEETNDASHGHILAFITICMLMATKTTFYFLSPFRHHKGCPHLQNDKKFLLKIQH
jgi:hypothetical protein